MELHVKLPVWFTMTPPWAKYNPDWAVVMKNMDEFGDVDEDRPLLYLVRETKSTNDRSKLRPDESRKIACGERHFASLRADYEVVTAGELP